MIPLSQLLGFVAFISMFAICLAFGLAAVDQPEGGIIGGLLGLFSGSAIWCILKRGDDQSMIRSAKKEFSDKSVEELRELLHEGKTLTPNLLLIALMLRGEEIDQDIFPVLNLLESEVSYSRVLGFAALRTGYPYLKQFICDYSPMNSLDVCRSQVSELRTWAQDQLVKD